MPERHAKLLKISVGQLRQDVGVDFTRAKKRLIRRSEGRGRKVGNRRY